MQRPWGQGVMMAAEETGEAAGEDGESLGHVDPWSRQLWGEPALFGRLSEERE